MMSSRAGAATSARVHAQPRLGGGEEGGGGAVGGRVCVFERGLHAVARAACSDLTAPAGRRANSASVGCGLRRPYLWSCSICASSTMHTSTTRVWCSISMVDDVCVASPSAAEGS
jgi:hypothetical protein